MLLSWWTLPPASRFGRECNFWGKKEFDWGRTKIFLGGKNMKQTWLLLITIVGTLLLAGAVVLLLARSASPASLVVDPSLISTGAKHVKGSDTAPVTVVEFSDFQCPACAAAQPIIKNVLSKYPDQVKLIYRHFPLTQLHPHAYQAAQASEVVDLLSASDSAQFWAYHDVLFAQKSAWSGLKDADAVRDVFIQYAVELGIDKNQFSEKMADDQVQTLINDDMKLGNQVGVSFTPSFFVNGKLYPAGELDRAVAEAIKNTK